MKKLLLSIFLVMALALPAFASDVAPEGEISELAITMPELVYKRVYVFDAFTSQGVQFQPGESPVTMVSIGSVLYGHIQWEMNSTVAGGGRKYIMKIINASGTVVYSDSVSYENFVESGARWQALEIPTGELSPGYYTMAMTLRYKTPAKDVVVKTLKTKFRIY